VFEQKITGFYKQERGVVLLVNLLQKMISAGQTAQLISTSTTWIYFTITVVGVEKRKG